MIGFIKRTLITFHLSLKTYLFQLAKYAQYWQDCTLSMALTHCTNTSDWVIDTLYPPPPPCTHYSPSLSPSFSHPHTHIYANTMRKQMELNWDIHNLWLMHWVVWLSSIIFIMLNVLSFSVSQIMFSLSGWCMGRTYNKLYIYTEERVWGSIGNSLIVMHIWVGGWGLIHVCITVCAFLIRCGW